MLNAFITFILAQRLLVVLSFVLLSVTGMLAWCLLPIDAFPDVTNVQVMVLTDAPGLASVDVEQRVTFPVELAMQGLPRVSQIRSLSKAGFSQVIVVFEDTVDIYFARQLVFERLQAARAELPVGVEPGMGPISTGLGEIYQYTLESKTRSPMELRTLQDWIVAPQLRTIASVNEVNSFGGFVKQYQVLVDQNRLLKYKLTLPEVLAGIEGNNTNAGGEFITQGWEQAYVRSVGLIQGGGDIESIVLRAADGTPVFLRDVATVVIGPQTRQGAVTQDGKGETVAGMVIMLRGANSKLVVESVKKAIPVIQASLPKDVHLLPFYDRTALIQACVGTVSKALCEGALFVILVLFMLLGSTSAKHRTGEAFAQAQGLSEHDDCARLAQDGHNELPTQKQRGVFAIALEVVREPMFLMLLAAGGLYLIMGEPADALMLLGFVFVMLGIKIIQERRTERALDALRRKCVVV
jgi:cobalt-zinc-cadmium resistance protein CzcA